jgi:hypothetical protein
MDPTPRKKKQKETSPPLGNQVAAGDPNLGSRLEHAVENRSQQAQQQVRSEQTPIKERIERNHSDKESDEGSSSVEGNSALDSAKGSGSSPTHYVLDLPPFSTLKENPEGTEQKWGDLPDESAEGDEIITIDDEENKDKESAKGSVSLPQESTEVSGTAPMASNSVSAPDPSTSVQGSSSVDSVEFPSVPRGRGSDEDRAQWAKFLSGTPLTEHNIGSERNPSARESHSREVPPHMTSSVDETPARLHPWLDPNEVEPRFAITDDLQAAIDDLRSKGVEEVMP